MYRRQGITYNSVAPAVPLNHPNNQPGSGIHVNGVGHPITVMGTSHPITINGVQGDTFTDSLLMYNHDSTNQLDFVGTTADNDPIVTAVNFVAGPKGFNLSQVGDLYRTDEPIGNTLKLRIKLGTNINSATTIYEQDVPVEADTIGHYFITKLDSSILIYPYENFWVEWEYADGMRYPQGIEHVPNDQMNNDFQYRKARSQDAYLQEFYAWRYYVAAYEEKDSTGGWLTLSPATAVINAAAIAPLSLNVNGPVVKPVDQHADVLIHSNDPATPQLKVTVNVHIDQAPYLTTHDTLTVYEADTISYIIPVVDKEGSTIKIVSGDTNAHIVVSDTAIYFVYMPGYFDAGMHGFPITLSDSFNNTRNDTIWVDVLNTNRAPVSSHFTKRTIYIGGAALQMALDSVFTDPDKDALTYTFLGDANSLVTVYLDSASGLLSVIGNDTGHVMLRFMATDIYGASVTDSMLVYVRKNVPPVAAAIPTQIIEAGADINTLDLTKWFTDADGDVLKYTVTVDSANLATATINGSLLLLNGKSEGNSLVTVTADNGNGGTVKTSFLLVVLNTKGNIINDYHITIGPNPFHKNTTIRFELGATKHVRIEVMGITGIVHSILFEGTKQAGFQTINANFDNLAAGSYLVRFTIDGKQGIIQVAKL